MNIFAKSACLFLFIVAGPVAAQSPPVLVSEDKAYFVGAPDLIVPANVLETSVSPNGRYLLATHSSPRTEQFQSVLPPPDPTQTKTTALTLYDARRQRTTTLWKVSDDSTQSTTPFRIFWLSDNETAIVELYHFKQISSLEPVGSQNNQPREEWNVSFLYINIPRQTTKRVPVVGQASYMPNFGVTPSPTRNEALVIAQLPDASYALHFLTGTGSLQSAISVPARSLSVTGWSADGNHANIRAINYDKSNKREVTFYTWERQTKTLERVTVPGKESISPTAEDASNTKRDVTLPIQIGVQKAVITAGQTKRETPCVVLQGKDGKQQYLLATDAEPLTVLKSGERLTVLYESGSATYAVPVYTTTYSEYATFMRRGIEANAKQISAAIEQWMMDNKAESLPQPFDPIAQLVGDGKSLYLKRDTPFRDPGTGAMIFKSIYTGKPDTTGNIPRFSLQSPFGRLTMYENGKSGIAWDPVEPPVKP